MRVKKFIAVVLDEDNKVHLFEPTEAGYREMNDHVDLETRDDALQMYEDCDDLDQALHLARRRIEAGME